MIIPAKVIRVMKKKDASMNVFGCGTVLRGIFMILLLAIGVSSSAEAGQIVKRKGNLLKVVNVSEPYSVGDEVVLDIKGHFPTKARVVKNKGNSLVLKTKNKINIRKKVDVEVIRYPSTKTEKSRDAEYRSIESEKIDINSFLRGAGKAQKRHKASDRRNMVVPNLIAASSEMRVTNHKDTYGFESNDKGVTYGLHGYRLGVGIGMMVDKGGAIYVENDELLPYGLTSKLSYSKMGKSGKDFAINTSALELNVDRRIYKYFHSGVGLYYRQSKYVDGLSQETGIKTIPYIEHLKTTYSKDLGLSFNITLRYDIGDFRVGIDLLRYRQALYEREEMELLPNYVFTKTKGEDLTGLMKSLEIGVINVSYKL